MMIELKDFSLSGNVVHSAWFQTITKENGKADLVAINILAEVVYWYKPIEIRDELTGAHVGWKNKYKDDLLQKSYGSIADQFGLGERQVKDSIIRLEKLGVIERVFRNISSKGMILNNVLYLKLNIDKLKELSFVSEELIKDNKSKRNKKKKTKKIVKKATVKTRKRDTCHVKKGYLSRKKGTPITQKCDTSNAEMGEGTHNNVTPPTPECHTNTKITTKITTEITTKSKNKGKTSAHAILRNAICKLFEEYSKGDDELLSCLIAFLDMRNSLKNGQLTEHATKLILTQLDKLGNSRNEKIAIINRSIINNWKGVFALPADYKTSETVYKGVGYTVEGTAPKSAFDKLREKYGE